MSQERTEKPTARRLREARKRGQSARSIEAAQAAGFLAVLAALPAAVNAIAGAVRGVFEDAARTATIATPELALELTRRSFVESGRALAPSLLLVLAASAGVQLALFGGRPNMAALAPRFERINPVAGMRRLFSKQLLWEFGRTTLKLAAVTAVVLFSWAEINQLFFDTAIGVAPFLLAVAREIQDMFLRVAVLGLVVGGIDAIVSRRRYLKGVRMTKQEVKDDMRNTEGNPAIKGEVRRRMFRMSRMRMMAEVVNASVVLTNPTHYAVALRYDDDDPAPVVVAKGAGETALRIRAKAAEHGVPVVEDKPLAQTLFRSTEIGDTIPAPLYEAVARVLVVLWRAKGAA